jgi:hypothetical protein
MQPCHGEQRQDIEIFALAVNHDHETGIRWNSDKIAMRDSILASVGHPKGEGRISLNGSEDLVTRHYNKYLSVDTDSQSRTASYSLSPLEIIRDQLV